MARHRGRQGEWPRVKNNPEAVFTNPDGYTRSNRELVGPLRMGTAPPVGPKGPAVIADYQTLTDYGTDMIARDRKAERKFPSDLISREIRGEGPTTNIKNMSEGKTKPD